MIGKNKNQKTQESKRIYNPYLDKKEEIMKNTEIKDIFEFLII